MSSLRRQVFARVLAIAGSPSQRSRSSLLLRHAAGILQSRGLAVGELGLRDIPAEELIEGHYAGAAANALRARVAAADAVLISTPVYQASFSGGLKAVLDLLDPKALAGKVVLPIATGGSPAHLLALEYGLKPVLSALGARHILPGDFQIGIRFVVAEQNVIARLQGLDQVIFKQQRLGFAARDRRLQPHDAFDHHCRARTGQRLLEIAGDALLEVASLADVQQIVVRIEVAVYAWQMRKFGDGLENGRARIRSSGIRHRRNQPSGGGSQRFRGLFRSTIARVIL